VLQKTESVIVSEIKSMTRLAVPLILAELGWMAMGVVDTMFVGRIGTVAIAAVGLGTIAYYAFGVCAAGLLLGLDTVVSQADGARDEDECRRWLVNGVWLAMLVVLPVM